MRAHRTRPGPARPGGVLSGVVLALVVVGLAMAGPGRASAGGTSGRVLAQPAPPTEVAPPSALVLVERLGMDEALAAVGQGGPAVAGFVSTLPVHQPLASRVLSLAAGRRVDALAALEGSPAGASALPDPATLERIRADNPGARFGRLPPTSVLAYPGLEAAGLFALGPGGQAPPVSPLGVGERLIPLRPGRLLVLAVPDAAALADLYGRLRRTPDAGPVMVAGLRAAPGRANAAPLLVLDQPLAGGLVTSGSTRRLGLVALEDVRPTVAGRGSAGDDGTVIGIASGSGTAAAVAWLDRRVAALVVARTWAIPLLCLAAVLALFALLATWRSRRPRGPGGLGQPKAADGSVPWRPAGGVRGTQQWPSRWSVGSSPADGVRGTQEGGPGGSLSSSGGVSRSVGEHFRKGAPVDQATGAAAPRSTGSGPLGPQRLARVLLALTLALPAGYLAASMAEPLAAKVWQAFVRGSLRDPGIVVPWAVAWVTAGVAIAAVLAALALRLDRPAPGPPSDPVPGLDPRLHRPAPGPPGVPVPRLDPRWGSVADRRAEGPWLSTGALTPGPRERLPARVPAPVLLGAVLLGLVVLDLVLGGEGLAQPLLGGSAWDGERFYGLGNGYFAFALAAAMLVIAFAPLAAVPAAVLLAGLAVVDGLPRLGADVGGTLTAMLTAAAALVVLARRRPSGGRAVLLAGLGVAAAVAVALGAGLGGPVTHAGRFAERLQQGPAEAAGVVVDQLARNLRLLANSPFAWAGPLQVVAAGLIALRPPGPLADLPGWIRRVLGLGAFGSLLLIVLNDTGVTATAASGLFLLAMPAWAFVDQAHPAGPPPSEPQARPAVGARPPGS